MKTIIKISIFLIVVAGNAQTHPNDSFAPTEGKYILSAWVKDVVTEQTHQYDGAIQVVCDYPTPSPDVVFNLVPTGTIIDGWQRVIGEFDVQSDIEKLNIKLISSGTGSYFDDIRVTPFNGSLKSFVYDPLNQRLMAELDENNYATFYEYDYEGGLVRVKKETERGVFTIQESRSKSSKVNNE